MFAELHGDRALLRSGGVYRIAKLYILGDSLFAAYGAGYVRLYANGSTSRPKTSVDRMHTLVRLGADKHGRLCTMRSGSSHRDLTAEEKRKLDGSE